MGRLLDQILWIQFQTEAILIILNSKYHQLIIGTSSDQNRQFTDHDKVIDFYDISVPVGANALLLLEVPNLQETVLTRWD